MVSLWLKCANYCFLAKINSNWRTSAIVIPFPVQCHFFHQSNVYKLFRFGPILLNSFLLKRFHSSILLLNHTFLIFLSNVQHGQHYICDMIHTLIFLSNNMLLPRFPTTTYTLEIHYRTFPMLGQLSLALSRQKNHLFKQPISSCKDILFCEKDMQFEPDINIEFNRARISRLQPSKNCFGLHLALPFTIFNGTKLD